MQTDRSDRRGLWKTRYLSPLALAALTLGGGTLFGQQNQQPAPGLPQPRVLVVMPSGGQAGATVEVAVTGYDLDDPQGLWFSAPGLKAEPLGDAPPPDLAKGKNRRQGGMQAAQGPVMSKRFKITIPADTPPGLHDLRLVNALGVSNPRAFAVGALAEAAEVEPNNDAAEAQRVALNSTVNGAITTPTDVDDFVFEGKKGQRVLVSGLASSIDSRLLLGLELYDATGKKLATGHEYQGTDALLDSTLPADGDYLVRAFAFTYTQGGAEYFYRLSISTAPWIDAVFPAVVEPGKAAQVSVFGRNLPGGRPDPTVSVEGRGLDRLDTTIEAPADAQALAFRGFLAPGSAGLDGFEYRIKNASGESNPFLIALAHAPVVLDRGSNETPETAQPVAPPCEIAGRIEAPRDRDWYAFEAKKGDVLSIEAFGERLGAPVDLYFLLRNPRSKAMLGEFDESAEAQRRGQQRQGGLLQFYNVTDDPDRHRFVAPEDGRYELMVSSREAPMIAGPRHYYGVRIAPERPDFRLVVMPASERFPDACVLARGGTMEATVHVTRLDGFTDPIALSVDDLPPGVTCPPQVVASNAKQATLILGASADAAPWTGTIAVKGTATIGGQQVVRAARAATITWTAPGQQQQTAPAIARLARGLMLAVRGQAPFRISAGPERATVEHGGKVSVPLKLDRLWPDFKGAVQLTAVGLPPGLTVNNLNFAADKNEVKTDLDIKPNVAPGVYSIVFRGQAQVAYAKDPKAKQKPNVNVVVTSTPVTLTIVPKELGKVSVNPNTANARAGESAALTVRVARQFEYAGPFQVEIVLPPDAKGIGPTAPATIPAGANELTLKLPIEPGAAPGTRANLTARLTAPFLDKVTTQEAKFSVNVNK